MSEPYEVVFTRSARRALEITLPESVAAAAFEFIVGPLAENPRRLGKPLREPLAPLYSARRGEYRVLYRIEDNRMVIEIVTIEHRRDAYRRARIGSYVLPSSAARASRTTRAASSGPTATIPWWSKAARHAASAGTSANDTFATSVYCPYRPYSRAASSVM